MSESIVSNDNADTGFLGHPIGLRTLFLTEMWERMSYYGMRALLVLYMTGAITEFNPGLGWSQIEAQAIYGIYVGMVYFMVVPGGWLADNILGHQKAVLYGAMIIALGHFTLAIPIEQTFFLGLIFVVFPLMFAFFTSAAPAGVAVMTDIASYLDFVLVLFFAFGIAFEVPIATVVLVWSGLTSVETLAKNRAYVFLGAFIIGMLITPPDVISQTLLAVPVYLLYECGILLSKILTNKKEGADE